MPFYLHSFTQADMKKDNKKRTSKSSEKRFVNNWYCEIEYRGKVHKAFAKDEREMLWAFAKSTTRHFKMKAHMNSENTKEEIGKDLWRGWTISVCGNRINWIMGFRGNRVREAAATIGSLGGSAGRGQSKVRGDSNYYQLLRMKGLEKRRQSSLKLSESGKNEN